MKPISVFLGIAVVVGFISFTDSFAQEKKISEKEVPTAVLDAFHKSYPKAEIKGTNMEIEKGKKCYEIESIDGTFEKDILYTAAGNTVEIEETIPASELPKDAAKSIKKKFPDGKTGKFEKVTSGSKITYEFIVESKKQKFEVTLNKDGKIVKSEKVHGNSGD